MKKSGPQSRGTKKNRDKIIREVHPGFLFRLKATGIKISREKIQSTGLEELLWQASVQTGKPDGPHDAMLSFPYGLFSPYGRAYSLGNFGLEFSDCNRDKAVRLYSGGDIFLFGCESLIREPVYDMPDTPPYSIFTYGLIDYAACLVRLLRHLMWARCTKGEPDGLVFEFYLADAAKWRLRSGFYGESYWRKLADKETHNHSCPNIPGQYRDIRQTPPSFELIVSMRLADEFCGALKASDTNMGSRLIAERLVGGIYTAFGVPENVDWHPNMHINPPV